MRMTNFIHFPIHDSSYLLLLFKLFIRFYGIKKYNITIHYILYITPLRVRQVRMTDLVTAPAPTEDMPSSGASGATVRAPRTSSTAVESACGVHWSTVRSVRDPTPLHRAWSAVSPWQGRRAAVDPPGPFEARVVAGLFGASLETFRRVRIASVTVKQVRFDSTSNHTVGCRRRVYRIRSPQCSRACGFFVGDFTAPQTHAEHLVRAKHSEVGNPSGKQSISNVVL